MIHVRRRWFRSFLLLPLALAFLPACSDDPTPPEDGDAESGNDSPEILFPDGDSGGTGTGVLGSFEITDSNAVAWYQAERIARLTLVVANARFSWVWTDLDDRTRCLAQPMTRETTTQFVPRDDPENCRYELAAEGERLEISFKSRADNGASTVTFVGQKLETAVAVPAGCPEESACLAY